MGTPPLAATVLSALLESNPLEVLAVVTQPDQPKGRDLKLRASAVKEFAVKHNLPVLQPEGAREPAFLEKLHKLAPDLIVVAAYGQILPQELLEVPRFGCLNVHTSLLPKYRGAAPIQWAILNGDSETGVTIMKMSAGLDTGDIVSKERTPISNGDDAATLHNRLAQIGGALLVRTIPEFVAGRINPHPQRTEDATYARKIKKEDGRLNWSRSASALQNQIRGLTPWPGTYAFLPRLPSPVLLKIYRAEVIEQQSGAPGEITFVNKDGIVVSCGEGAMRIQELQREGGRRLNAQTFLAGFPINVGEKLI